MKAINIEWDVDDPKDLEDLPTEVEIPANIDPDDPDEVSDYLSDLTGFCHRGFELEDDNPVAPASEAHVPAKRCPICGGTTFLVTAHVTQGWEVDGDGNFLKCTNECEEVTHTPDDDDMWVCSQCGHDAAGRDFNIDAQKDTPAHAVKHEARRKLSLDVSLDELDLSARSYNLLWRNGKTTIGAVADMTKEELFKIRNMGAESVHEIISKLAVAGIFLREDTPISADI